MEFRSYDVVIVGSAATGPKVDLLHNPKYPGQAADYERSFMVLKSLPVDILLSPHGVDFNMEEKVAQLQRNGTTNPFVDPSGYKQYLARSESEFRRAGEAEGSGAGCGAIRTGPGRQ
jgi:metallo-beta-lactamase class B